MGNTNSTLYVYQSRLDANPLTTSKSAPKRHRTRWFSGSITEGEVLDHDIRARHPSINDSIVAIDIPSIWSSHDGKPCQTNPTTTRSWR